MITERKQRFALGDWIVEPEFHTLVQGQVSYPIEPKVLSVLLELAAHPGRVVSKEEFLSAVWPDTFVSEDALTRCISVLRHLLQDDPHHPRFIKTVPKVGYCLLLEARPLDPLSPSGTSSLFSANFPSSSPPPSLLPRQEEQPLPFIVPVVGALPPSGSAAVPPLQGPVQARPVDRRTLALMLVCLLLVCAVAALFVRSNRHVGASAAMPIATFHLTTDAGEQSLPAVSPDSRQLALVWKKERGEHQQIYVKQIGSESLQRLTDLEDDEYSPVWSPDGASIAFLASGDAGLALYVSPLDSPHTHRKIYIPGATTRWEQGALAWSPDGRYFVLADHIGDQPSSSLYRIDAQTLLVHPLSNPPPGWEGDVSPVYSPDGTKIAFLRASESAVADIYWIAAEGGPPHRVTHDGGMINGITWSSDARSIVFSSNRAGEYSLWRAALEGSAPERLPVGTEDATQPAISRDGRILSFVGGSAIFGIRRIAEANHGDTGIDATIVASTAQDSAPSVSPNGAEFAFQSWRSGSQQIWIAALNGSLQQLTPAGGNLSGSGSPSWSPGGDKIAFDSRLGGHSHIFVISAQGGAPRQLTFSEVNDIVPRWSADGRYVYFRSNRGGRWQLWKVSATGGMPQPVTRDDGMAGQESADGKWLFFSRGGEPGIWRMPAAGGEEERILDQPSAGYWAYWAVQGESLYFMDMKQGDLMVSVYDVRTHKVSAFAKLDRVPPLYAGLGVFPGGQEILISDKHDAGSHISLARGSF